MCDLSYVMKKNECLVWEGHLLDAGVGVSVFMVYL